MNYKNLLALALLLAVIGAVSIIWQRPWELGASVSVGNDYQSTTTPNVADLANLCPQVNPLAASSTTGILGSIVVTGPNVGNFQIYDASTSIATLRKAADATSTILLFDLPSRVAGDATSTGQTYTLDVGFKRGLLIDKVGSVATTTITFRCEG